MSVSSWALGHQVIISPPEILGEPRHELVVLAEESLLARGRRGGFVSGLRRDEESGPRQQQEGDQGGRCSHRRNHDENLQGAQGRARHFLGDPWCPGYHPQLESGTVESTIRIVATTGIADIEAKNTMATDQAHRPRESERTPLQEARLDAIRARCRTPEARAEEARVRAAFEREIDLT